MNLTLAEAAIGAGAVLEAPASIAQAGLLSPADTPLTRAPSLPASFSLPCVERSLTGTILLRPQLSVALSPL